MKRPHTFLLFMMLVVLGSGLWGACSPASSGEKKASPQTVKNVIVLIPDGCSAEQYTLARWFKGEPLALDQIRVGAIKTYIADSVVADSAPAASAFATGYRTSDKFISVGPKNPTLPGVPPPDPSLSYKPLATVLEGAKLLGKATGLVVTSRVTHATPAAYYAHVPARRMENDIMEQGVYQNLDVVLGGGKRHLLSKEYGGKRTDDENLMDVLQERGYTFVATAEELQKAKSGKVYGIFAYSNMEGEIDRPEFAPQQPTLEDMTKKALDLLSRDPEGFFLLVEGSQVDWACHANDPAHLLSDLLMFDRAVQAALDFAQKDGNTLVMAFSDHNCGGMSIGNYATSGSYSQMKPEALLAPLKKMKLSTLGLSRKVGADKTPGKVKAVVQEFWGLEITEEEAKQILDLARQHGKDPNYGFGEVICPKYTYIGWTTYGHTGGDVPLFAFGPGRPVGLLDGPDMGKICARALGLNLERLNNRLFQEAAGALPSGQVTIDKTDPENPVVKIVLQKKQAELPVNKNLLKLDGKTTQLEGVVVYAPNTGKAYIPLQAVNLIKGSPAALPSITEK
ncbi:MAG: alkaline phosphatase [Syntrophobacterales bacterium]|jgi:alkaline phosphatase